MEADVMPPGIIAEKASSRRSHAPTISLYKENILNRLPTGFRKWHPSIHPSGVAAHSGKSHRMFMSGSGQFSEEGLKTLISKISHSGKIYIIDLRAEPHGYVNGHAIYFRASSRNKGRRAFSPSAIDAREQSYLKSLLGGYEVALRPHPKMKARVEYIKVEQVATEKQLVESLGLGYARIPVEDYRHPTDAQVDRFVALVRKLKRRSWLHFHCKAGKGRTTLFMMRVAPRSRATGRYSRCFSKPLPLPVRSALTNCAP